MHGKNLSAQLLKNSEISGVVIDKQSLKLSEIAHGLYIESEQGDRYADLRLCCHKPFWGHSHPLWLQYKFGQLKLNPEAGFNLSQLDGEARSKMLTGFETISCEKLLKGTFTNQKLHLILSEKEILLLAQDRNHFIGQLKELNKKNKLIIEEVDLVLNCDKDIFYTHKVDSTKILNLSFMKQSFVTSGIADKLSQEEQLIFAMDQFLEYLVFPANGKNSIDYNLIDKFIEDFELQPYLQREARYLVLTNKAYEFEQFLDQGLLTAQDNHINTKVYLALPVSCTNNELLDTLVRIKDLIRS